MRLLLKAAEIIGKAILLTAGVTFGGNLIIAIILGMYQAAVLLAILFAVAVFLFVRLRALTKKTNGKDEQFSPAPHERPGQAVTLLPPSVRQPYAPMSPLLYLPEVNDAGEQR